MANDQLSANARMLLAAWTTTVAPDTGGRYDGKVGCVGIKYDRTKIDFIDDITAMQEIMQFAIRMSSAAADVSPALSADG